MSRKIYYLNNIIQSEGEDIFDWIKNIYYKYDLLSLRLRGKKVKIYVSEYKAREIDSYDIENCFGNLHYPSLDIFLFIRKIEILMAKDGLEKLVIY